MNDVGSARDEDCPEGDGVWKDDSEDAADEVPPGDPREDCVMGDASEGMWVDVVGR